MIPKFCLLNHRFVAYFNQQNLSDFVQKVEFCEIDRDKVRTFVNYRKPHGKL